VWINYYYVGGLPTSLNEVLKKGGYRTRLSGTCRTNNRSMADNEARSFETDWHLLSCGQTTQPQVFVIRLRKYRGQLLRRSKVNRVIQTGIRANASLKRTGTTIDLTKKLNL
jgi:hypothetical protein